MMTYHHNDIGRYQTIGSLDGRRGDFSKRISKTKGNLRVTRQWHRQMTSDKADRVRGPGGRGRVQPKGEGLKKRENMRGIAQNAPLACRH